MIDPFRFNLVQMEENLDLKQIKYKITFVLTLGAKIIVIWYIIYPIIFYGIFILRLIFQLRFNDFIIYPGGQKMSLDFRKESQKPKISLKKPQGS